MIDFDYWEDLVLFFVGGKFQLICILINVFFNLWIDVFKVDVVEVWKVMMDVVGDEVCFFMKENLLYECKKLGLFDIFMCFFFLYGNVQFIVVSFMWIVVIIIKCFFVSNFLGWKVCLLMEDKWF